MSFDRVLVVGAGQMGAGIAQVVAASGRECPAPRRAARGRRARARDDRSEASASSTRRAGRRLTTVLGRITPVDSLTGADLMIEAIVEDAGAKKELFRSADAALPAEAILASNTSSIPITELARSHFAPRAGDRHALLQPGPDARLVEVIRAEQTSDETAEAIVALARDLGKTPAEANDFPGFVSNRILMPFINEAAYALMEGVAEPRRSTPSPGSASRTRWDRSRSPT